jgi:hypothetical protein
MLDTCQVATEFLGCFQFHFGILVSKRKRKYKGSPEFLTDIRHGKRRNSKQNKKLRQESPRNYITMLTTECIYTTRLAEGIQIGLLRKYVDAFSYYVC